MKLAGFAVLTAGLALTACNAAVPDTGAGMTEPDAAALYALLEAEAEAVVIVPYSGGAPTGELFRLEPLGGNEMRSECAWQEELDGHWDCELVVFNTGDPEDPDDEGFSVHYRMQVVAGPDGEPDLLSREVGYAFAG